MTSDEARFGMISAEVNGHPMLTISFGATSPEGSLSLYMSGYQLPSAGRYPVRAHLERSDGTIATLESVSRSVQ